MTSPFLPQPLPTADLQTTAPIIVSRGAWHSCLPCDSELPFHQHSCTRSVHTDIHNTHHTHDTHAYARRLRRLPAARSTPALTTHDQVMPVRFSKRSVCDAHNLNAQACPNAMRSIERLYSLCRDRARPCSSSDSPPRTHSLCTECSRAGALSLSRVCAHMYICTS